MLKPCFALLVNLFSVNVSVTAVQCANRFYKLVFCRKNWPKCKKIRVKKYFSQCHSAVNFWQQVPEREHPEFKIPVHYSFLCIGQHIAVNFFLFNEVRKIKPPRNHKNEHLGELIRTALTTYCPGFRGLENQTRTSYWQLLYIIINVQLAFFTLHTDNHCTSFM